MDGMGWGMGMTRENADKDIPDTGGEEDGGEIHGIG